MGVGPKNTRHVDPIPIIGLIDFIWMCIDRHGQKLMDRRLRVQVVEEPTRLTK